MRYPISSNKLQSKEEFFGLIDAEIVKIMNELREPSLWSSSSEKFEDQIERAEGFLGFLRNAKKHYNLILLAEQRKNSEDSEGL